MCAPECAKIAHEQMSSTHTIASVPLAASPATADWKSSGGTNVMLLAERSSVMSVGTLYCRECWQTLVSGRDDRFFCKSQVSSAAAGTHKKRYKALPASLSLHQRFEKVQQTIIFTLVTV